MMELVISPAGKTRVALYVEPTSRKWVVLDPDGNFWILPNVEIPWDRRQPFFSTQERQLVPIPAHYKSLIELPFYLCPGGHCWLVQQ